MLDEIPNRYWDEIQLDSGDGKIEEQLEQLAAKREEDVFNIEAQYSEKISKLTKGDELPPGVIKMVKVYIAIKRKLSGRRQDGRSPRQQGRRLARSSPRRTCRTSRTARRSTSC